MQSLNIIKLCSSTTETIESASLKMDLSLAKNKAVTLSYIGLEVCFSVLRAIHYPLCLYH